MNLPLLIVMIIVYMAIMSWLAYLGNKQTKTAEDYLVAGRRIHPLVMALSYGATFISTSAIIGFGGASALYGFGMLWLAFLNIFVGIFVAFAAFGVRLRRMASNLGATTFPTLLGERYQSRWITAFSGLMIFLFMPAYTSIVLIGGGRFLQETLKVDFNIGLMLLAIIVGLYVITGGLKAVMYTDAFCALVMTVGMVFLLFSSYSAVGGVIDGHEGLSAMRDLVPQALAEQGHRGWTAMPEFGSPLWWTLVSTLILGVG
ncbi:MAG: sodium:solute symporter family protein, partial [Planifilum fulgidum]